MFNRLGIILETVQQAGCCGALHHHLGDSREGLARARANIDAWWPAIEQGAEAIVITASGCAPMVKDYGRLLADDPDYATRAARVSALAKDVSEVLAGEDLAAIKPVQKRRISFHSPCSLQHGQKLNGVVEALLTRLGYTLLPVRDAHLCCANIGCLIRLQAEAGVPVRHWLELLAAAQ